MLAAILLLTALYGFLLLLIQRAEKSRRVLVFIVLLPIGGMVHWFATVRDAGSASVIALIVAASLNGLFWILIGRYNPVGSSDDIKVIGLDD